VGRDSSFFRSICEFLTDIAARRFTKRRAAKLLVSILRESHANGRNIKMIAVIDMARALDHTSEHTGLGLGDSVFQCRTVQRHAVNIENLHNPVSVVSYKLVQCLTMAERGQHLLKRYIRR